MCSSFGTSYLNVSLNPNPKTLDSKVFQAMGPWSIAFDNERRKMICKKTNVYVYAYTYIDMYVCIYVYTCV